VLALGAQNLSLLSQYKLAILAVDSHGQHQLVEVNLLDLASLDVAAACSIRSLAIAGKLDADQDVLAVAVHDLEADLSAFPESVQSLLEVLPLGIRHRRLVGHHKLAVRAVHRQRQDLLVEIDLLDSASLDVAAADSVRSLALTVEFDAQQDVFVVGLEDHLG